MKTFGANILESASNSKPQWPKSTCFIPLFMWNVYPLRKTPLKITEIYTQLVGSKTQAFLIQSSPLAPPTTPSPASGHRIRFRGIYNSNYPNTLPRLHLTLSRPTFLVFHRQSPHKIQTESWRSLGRWAPANLLCAFKMLPKDWVGFPRSFFHLPPPHKLQHGHKKH